jgi:hypothetical protein
MGQDTKAYFRDASVKIRVCAVLANKVSRTSVPRIETNEINIEVRKWMLHDGCTHALFSRYSITEIPEIIAVLVCNTPHRKVKNTT